MLIKIEMLRGRYAESQMRMVKFSGGCFPFGGHITCQFPFLNCVLHGTGLIFPSWIKRI